MRAIAPKNSGYELHCVAALCHVLDFFALVNLVYPFL